MDKINVLVVTGVDFDNDGVHLLLSSIFSRLDPDKYSIDWYCRGFLKAEQLKQYVNNMGINVYTCNLPDRSMGDKVSFTRTLEKAAASKKYDVIHCNSCARWINAACAHIGRKYKIKTRISHTHYVNFSPVSLSQRVLRVILTGYIDRSFTDYFACSQKAGKAVFGSKVPLKIVNNGIDTQKFAFNPVSRSNIRAKYDISDNTYVIGCVGTLTDEKNHTYLLEIFSKLVQKHNDSILLIVGEGVKYSDLKQQAKLLMIEDKVIFAGFQKDIENYYSAFDLFMLTSECESFGMVCVEAQCTGLSCVVSDVVPRETDLTGHVEYLSMQDNAEYWAKRVLDHIKIIDRHSCQEIIAEKNFDILQTVNLIDKVYSRGQL